MIRFIFLINKVPSLSFMLSFKRYWKRDFGLDADIFYDNYSDYQLKILINDPIKPTLDACLQIANSIVIYLNSKNIECPKLKLYYDGKLKIIRYQIQNFTISSLKNPYF